MRNKISQKVIDLISYQVDKRDEEGIKEYGQSMEDVNFDAYKWNDMVIEELVDGIKYIAKENERLKTRLNNVVKSLDILNAKIIVESLNSTTVMESAILLAKHSSNSEVMSLLRRIINE